MLVGAFDLREPLPRLHDPHMFVTVTPWLDAGQVGSLSLAHLNLHFGATEVGRLRRPGDFFDYTRYRPIIYRLEGGARRVEVPNVIVMHASRPEANDIIALRLVEPTAHAEDYVDSVIELAHLFEVKRYTQLGASYGAGPHSRPLRRSGRSSNPDLEERIGKMGIRTGFGGGYQGPTTMLALITERLREAGVETLNLSVQLPPYARLEEDHTGVSTVLDLVDKLYGLGLNLQTAMMEGARQYGDLDRAVTTDMQLAAQVRQLEWVYDSDARQGGQQRAPEPQRPEAPLPPVFERLMKDLEEGRGGASGS